MDLPHNFITDTLDSTRVLWQNKDKKFFAYIALGILILICVINLALMPFSRVNLANKRYQEGRSVALKNYEEWVSAQADTNGNITLTAKDNTTRNINLAGITYQGTQSSNQDTIQSAVQRRCFATHFWTMKTNSGYLLWSDDPTATKTRAERSCINVLLVADGWGLVSNTDSLPQPITDALNDASKQAIKPSGSTNTAWDAYAKNLK